MEWSVVLMGNFDEAALADDDLPGWTARVAAETVFEFRRNVLRQQKLQTINPFLQGLRRSVQRSEALYVHGTPRQPTYEYLNPDDVYSDKKMAAIFADFKGLCFCGHTHIPGVFMHCTDWSYLSQDDCRNGINVDSSQLLVNVGSVGQPRDNDPRACYVLFDGKTIHFRRLEYEIQRTMQKLRKLPEGKFLAERLIHGR